MDQSGERSDEDRSPRGWLARMLRPDWMERDAYLLLLARTAMSVTRAMAGILAPIYLALIGFSALQLGALFTVGAVTSAIISTSSGLLSDRIGRKVFLVVVPLFAAAAGLVFGFSRAVPVIFFFSALGSFGRGAGAGGGMIGPYQPVEQAYLAGSVKSRYRNALFGRVGFASSLGALIAGPLAGIPALVQQMTGVSTIEAYRPAFVVTALLAVVASLLALPIHDQKPQRPSIAPQAQTRRAWRPRLPRLHLSRPTWGILLRLSATNLVNGLAIGFFGPFITYWFFRRYGAGSAEIGLLYAIINLAALVSNLQAANVARRLGLVRAISIGRMLQAVLMVPMVLAPSFWLAGGIYLLRMFAQRMALPLRQSYVMGVVPAEERGRVSAISTLPSQVTMAVTPPLAGYLFDQVSLSLPFEVGALLQAINAAMFWLFFRNMRPPEEQPREPRAASAEPETAAKPSA